MVRGDSVYGNQAVIGACPKAQVGFSVVLTKNGPVNRAIAAIGDQQWQPVAYPGSVIDPTPVS